jgi:hypothetical protein
MLTTINHTNRYGILKKDFTFETFETPSGGLEFNVALDCLDRDNFPSTAKIFVEAKANFTSQLFDCGTVSDFKQPEKRSLNELDHSVAVKFNVRIVDTSHSLGLVLGLGEGFKANNDPDNEVELLPIVTHDLGQLPWKVDFSVVPHELVINNAIPNAIEIFKNNGSFKALVLPAALKEILTYCLASGSAGEDENSKRWMLFAESLDPERPEDYDSEISERWIANVVSEFCMRFSWTQELVSKLTEANDS